VDECVIGTMVSSILAVNISERFDLIYSMKQCKHVVSTTES
jgi:hypothetical protein